MEKNFDMPTITKRMKASQSVVIVLKGEAIPTIADRGTSADIVSLDMAQQLVTEGVVDQIHEPLISVAIQFGIKTATVPVIGIIYGKGLLGNVYVVENGLATALISDITFTEKGVILVEDNVHLIGIAGGQIIFVGARDPTVPRTDSKAMWRLDIRALLLQEDPRIQMREIEQQHNQTAWDIINKLGIDTNTAQCGYQEMEQHSCYGAKPTFAIKDVRMGRAILKALGVSAFTLANSVERNAFKNIPLFLTPALLRAIGNDRGNIPSLLTTARKKALGGTGIRSTKEGECMSFDLEGKHPKSTWGCCFSGAFWDEYTRWGVGSTNTLQECEGNKPFQRAVCQESESQSHPGPAWINRSGEEEKKDGRREDKFTNKQYQEQSQIETSTKIIASIPLPRTTSSVLGGTPERINTYSCSRLETSQRWFKSTCLAGGLVHLVKIREM